jgi:CO/xanthine dehydrogenase FAD-binding subunit
VAYEVLSFVSDERSALTQGATAVHTEGNEAGPPRLYDYMRETVLEPAEIITEIVVPPPAGGLRSSYRKVRARRAWDFALAGVALAIVF